ncbi:methionyl-tRNA formyltransferase [Photorhabdus tasmaniensis]|uniref:methionyl-tRNA formyltransferase n=1 Tax=Photorhabdus tasmaniensis TaxID=1004159 RepID=UPI004041CAA9
MKIGYFADGRWSHKAIELISKAPGIEVVFIVPRYDTQDPILKEWSEKLDVPYLLLENVNSKESLDKIRSFDADVLVSMSFNQILKKEIINLTPIGFINCHAGALPFYRGRNPLNWVLINGGDSFGITVHYVDEDIDTGDIIQQEIYRIGKNDTYNDLLEKAVIECASVLYESLLKIMEGDFEPIKQKEIHPIGTYFGMRRFGDELINFYWSAEKVHNFVRAISTPGPCARCFISEQEYAIHESRLIDGAPKYIATVGEILGRNDEGVVVKVGDSTLLITKMSLVKDGKLTEVFTPRLKIGTRFHV